MTRTNGFGAAAGMKSPGANGPSGAPISGNVPKNVEPSRPIFEKPNKDQEEGEEYDDEDEYDEEDDNLNPAGGGGASKSFFVGLDSSQMGIGPAVNNANNRNLTSGFQSNAEGSIGALQNQPVPD